VKRKWIIATSGVAVAAALVYVGTLWAQQPAGSPAVPARPAAAPRTKIALLNLTYVITYYEKYKTFKDDIKKQMQPLEDLVKSKQAEMEALRKEGTDPAKPATEQRKQEIEKQMREDQRMVEDATNEAKPRIIKQEQDEMVLLYKEVQAAAAHYALGHDFDVVLQYNDAIDPKDYMGPGNVERKMGAGALIPLYYSSGMEISQDVLAMLNSNYRPAGTAATAPTPGGN
jgi:Skp family chaperone for outer membrane proteins